MDPLNKVPSSISGGVANSPLLLHQPFNLVIFLTFYSPIILAMCFFSMSFIFQNFNGIVYLAFLIGSCLIREFMLYSAGMKEMVPTRDICSMVQYSKYGNSGFSIFVFSFTLLYICLPMFLNSDINYWVLSGLLVYLLIDVGIRYSKQCITTALDGLLNFLSGATFGILFSLALYTNKGANYLFYNDFSSNNETCSMAKKQTFKCKMYKNGMLVGDV